MLRMFELVFRKFSQLPALARQFLSGTDVVPLEHDGRIYKVSLVDLKTFIDSGGLSSQGLNSWLVQHAVCWDQAQSLNPTQQLQAWVNLGLPAAFLLVDGSNSLTDVQRTAIASCLGLTGGAVLSTSGSACMIVTDTGNAANNGSALQLAYTAAKSLTPNGAALSATNRATVLLLPGVYNLGDTPLALSARYVDLVGITGDPTHARITSQVAVANSGTIVQTVSDVRLKGLTIARTGSGVLPNPVTNRSAAAATCAWCFANLSSATLVEDCVFTDTAGYCMRRSTSINGTYKRCVAGTGSFGSSLGSLDAVPFTVSGVYDNCTAGSNSFGYSENGVVTIRASFKDCVAGNASFGAGDTVSFGGLADRCAAGNSSFLCAASLIVFPCILRDCTAGSTSFGPGGISGSCVMLNCGGSSGSFGARLNGAKAYRCMLDSTPVDDGATGLWAVPSVWLDVDPAEARIAASGTTPALDDCFYTLYEGYRLFTSDGVPDYGTTGNVRTVYYKDETTWYAWKIDADGSHLYDASVLSSALTPVGLTAWTVTAGGSPVVTGGHLTTHPAPAAFGGQRIYVGTGQPYDMLEQQGSDLSNWVAVVTNP